MAITIEEAIPILDKILEQRRGKWSLHIAAGYFDYEDFKQELFLHVTKKFELYDQTKPIEPWLNTIVMHKMHNKLESLWYNIKSPCVNCEYNLGDDACQIYGVKSTDCKLYRKYIESGRQNAYNIRVPISLNLAVNDENKTTMIDLIGCEKAELNIPELVELFHVELKKKLTVFECRVYSAVYERHLSDREAAKEFYYKGSGLDAPGGGPIREIRRIKEVIWQKAQAVARDLV